MEYLVTVYHFECDENETIHDNDGMDQHNVYQYVMQLTTNFGQPLLNGQCILLITSKGVYEFNTRNGECRKTMEYTEDIQYNPRDAVYAIGSAFMLSHGLLHILDPEENIFNAYEYARTDDGSLVNVNGAIHHITKSVDTNHREWITHNKADWVYRALNGHTNLYDIDPEIESMHGNKAVYSKSTNSILLFGGVVDDNISDRIYEFSLSSKQWKRLAITLPIQLADYGIIKSRRERVIVLFGGVTSNDQKSDSIYIYDTVKRIFIESRIKTPEQGKYYALNKRDKQQDVLASFGYIKAIYKQFQNLQLLPVCLIQMISTFYCNEIIYLFQNGCNGGHVYSIKLDDILANVV